MERITNFRNLFNNPIGMSIEEFKKTGFTSNMKIRYRGNDYDLIQVDFTEYLFGIDFYGDPDDTKWVRCENTKLIIQ